MRIEERAALIGRRSLASRHYRLASGPRRRAQNEHVDDEGG